MDINKEDIIKRAENTISSDGSVDVTKLTNDLGIEVYEYNFGDALSGAVTKNHNGDKYSIFVSENDPITRQRFSIAHELAHMILHKDTLINEGIMHRNKYDKSKAEEEANKLAEEILMPKNLVQNFLSSCNLDSDSTITSKVIDVLATKFKVSKYVAIIRLRNLNYNVPYIYYA